MQSGGERFKGLLGGATESVQLRASWDWCVRRSKCFKDEGERGVGGGVVCERWSSSLTGLMKGLDPPVVSVTPPPGLTSATWFVTHARVGMRMCVGGEAEKTYRA